MNKSKRNMVNLTNVNPSYARDLAAIINSGQKKIGQSPKTKFARKIGHVLPRGMRK